MHATGHNLERPHVTPSASADGVTFDTSDLEPGRAAYFHRLEVSEAELLELLADVRAARERQEARRADPSDDDSDDADGDDVCEPTPLEPTLPPDPPLVVAAARRDAAPGDIGDWIDRHDLGGEAGGA